ncbi:Adaptive-response sensory-kinase SasA [bioreactor metagenome]|uniref:histidine kinase n=1 Tax=bioreactor metagenome TaxID=1076179 RepID=A0A645DBJ2_9ZZZZ
MSVVNYAKHKKINIVFDTEIEEKIIKCDEDMMERAMLNLLSNAIKFTKQNGNVLVNMYADEKWIHIIVKDDGMGIPIEMQGTIFERFVQNDKSLTRLNEGSGIGLSIVQSAVKLNEGEIYLDSDGKNGTEFEILLPNKKLEGEDLDDRIYKVDVSNIELELSDIYELYI